MGLTREKSNLLPHTLNFVSGIVGQTERGPVWKGDEQASIEIAGISLDRAAKVGVESG